MVYEQGRKDLQTLRTMLQFVRDRKGRWKTNIYGRDAPKERTISVGDGVRKDIGYRGDPLLKILLKYVFVTLWKGWVSEREDQQTGNRRYRSQSFSQVC